MKKMGSKYLKSNKLEKIEFGMICLILFLPLVSFIPSFYQIPFSANSSFSDLMISHIPNMIDVRDSLARYHQIPLWSDTILGGYPFISDPLSGIWYPPLWVTWFFALPASINGLIMLHLFLCEVGMYLFLNKKGLTQIACVVGALFVGISPKVFGHYAAGHITLVMAYSWTPWLLLFSFPSRKFKLNEKLPSILVLAFIILADVRWAAFAMVLYSGYHLFLILTLDPLNNRVASLATWSKTILFQIVSAIMICLPYLLLLWQYSALSTRVYMTITDQLTLSLPVLSLFGMVFPDMAGFAEWITYTGALTTLILLHVLFSKADKETWFWFTVYALAILFALGIRPVADFIFAIPGLSLLRVPSRSLFVGIIALGVIVAGGVDLIIRKPKEERVAKAFWLNLLTFGVGIFSLLVAVGISLASQKISVEFLWGAVFYVLFFILLLFRDRGVISGKLWGGLLVPLLILDLLTVGLSEIRFENYAGLFTRTINMVNLIKKDGKEGRIYSPSYSIPQQSAAFFNLELSDGVDPIQLKSYADFMAKATGVNDTGYSVTIPPFKNGNPELDNINFTPDLTLLGQLNVRYIVSEFDLNLPALKYLGTSGASRLYENLEYQARARLLSQTSITVVKIKKENEGVLDLWVKGPGTLVLSEVNFPGWEVWVNGKEKELKTVDGLFRAVDLENGEQQVVFKFRPVLAWVGWGILGLYLSVLVAVKFGLAKRT